MDSLQEWGVLFFNVKQVSNFLTHNRAQYGKQSKFIELQIALLFVLFLSRNNKEEYLIGFPTLGHSVNNAPPSLRQIIDRKIALDEDFDIVIAPKEKVQQKNHRLQIVRFIGDVEGSTQNLLDFLKEKKFNIPKDETLILLVMLEKGFQLNYLKLGQELEETDVPYAQIFLVGQRKPDDSYTFFCFQVFPEVKRFRDLDFGFLKRTSEVEP